MIANQPQSLYKPMNEEMAMKLNIKGLAIAAGITWAAVVLMVGLANLVWAGYGAAFLATVSSVYPGFEPGSLMQVFIGTGYGFVDGAIGGAVFAWVYNLFSD